MITHERMTVVHVAEAGENSGRVVLRLASPTPHRVAVEAALRIARAYQSELESLYIEDQQLIDVCSHGGVQEVSLCGRETRTLSSVTTVRQFAWAARRAERHIASMARLAHIPYRARTMRDEALHALNRACAESGPWNIVAIADPVRPGDRREIIRLIADLSGATAVVLVGPRATRAHGPIVVVLEEAERLMAMVRAAERLAADQGDAIVLLQAPASGRDAQAMDEIVRHALAGHDGIRHARAARSFGHSGALAETVRRLQPGFLIGQAGGALLPSDQDWFDLAQALESPLFVVR